jgi:hypothetical protein
MHDPGQNLEADREVILGTLPRAAIMPGRRGRNITRQG